MNNSKRAEECFEICFDTERFAHWCDDHGIDFVDASERCGEIEEFFKKKVKRLLDEVK